MQAIQIWTEKNWKQICFLFCYVVTKNERHNNLKMIRVWKLRFVIANYFNELLLFFFRLICFLFFVLLRRYIMNWIKQTLTFLSVNFSQRRCLQIWWLLSLRHGAQSPQLSFFWQPMHSPQRLRFFFVWKDNNIEKKNRSNKCLEQCIFGFFLFIESIGFGS